jgi:multidrug efflux pump subunit AcrB
VPGVASATVGGGKQREIQVDVDPDQLRARGMGILDVVSAVRSSNLLFASGSMRAGDRDYNVFTNTQIEDARRLEDVVLRAEAKGTQGQGASVVRVRDVGRVEDGTVEQANVVRVGGGRGVYLRVLKQPGANTIEVVDQLRKAMGNLRGVPTSTVLDLSFDQSRYIRSAVGALEHEAVQGGVLAALVILVFLASVRSTAIVSVAIPLSIVATFVLLYFAGQTLNVFTLGGLALGVGRLVDDSIVELENIHRHLEHDPKDRKGAVLSAAQEVAMPILVSTITTIVVFFPVLFLKGVARNLFLPLALTISFALVMSFFVSRTVTPLLCLYWMRAEAPEKMKGPGGAILRWLSRVDDAYARMLRWVLRRRALVVVAILAGFGASLTLFPRIGTEFFPDSDESQFSLIYKTPIGTRVERTEEVGKRLEAIVDGKLTKPGRGKLYTTSLDDVGLPGGRTALFTANTGPHSGNLQVNLVPRAQRADSDVALAERVRAALGELFPGTQVVFFTGGIVKRILNFGAAAPIDVEIVGYDLEEAAAYASRVAHALRGVADASGASLLTDVQIGREENYPELDVVVDREKAGALGITQSDVAQTVAASLVGSSQFAPIPYTDPKSGNEYPISVRLDPARRAQVNDLSDMLLRTPSGNTVALSNVARIERSSGPVTIARKYLQRVVDVTANVAPGKDLGSATAGVRRALEDLPPPDGFTVGLSGQSEAQRQAFAGLGFAGILALALVYMVLASQFRSLVDPLVIMFSVPLGISGVLVALWATKTTLSVNSAMGAIMMIGIVVSNGVLLVDFANVLRRRGEDIVEATVQAGRTRLRPILMTTIATIFGLLPMALGVGEGSETNLPLARAVIGGLTVSTVFTLFLVPCLYTALDRFAKRAADED